MRFAVFVESALGVLAAAVVTLTYFLMRLYRITRKARHEHSQIKAVMTHQMDADIAAAEKRTFG